MGRKYSLVLCELMTCLFGVLAIFFNSEFMLLISIMKFWIATTFTINICYAVEIYNTNIRVSALGVCNFFGRIAGAIMPFATTMLDEKFHDAYAPYWPMIILTGISGLMILTVPYRTVGRPMDNLGVSYLQTESCNIDDLDDLVDGSILERSRSHDSFLKEESFYSGSQAFGERTFLERQKFEKNPTGISGSINEDEGSQFQSQSIFKTANQTLVPKDSIYTISSIKNTSQSRPQYEKVLENNSKLANQ